MKLLIATLITSFAVGAGLLLTPPPSTFNPYPGGRAWGSNCVPDGGAQTVAGGVDQLNPNTPLTPPQHRNAQTILSVAVQRRIPQRGAELAIATALVESNLLNLASHAVPESLAFPHDDVAPGDYDSVGLMQQRPSQGWGNVSDLMNPAYAVGKFFDELVRIDYQHLAFTDAAQTVQRSAFPDRYGQHQLRAARIVAQLTGGMTKPCVSAPASFAQAKDVQAVVEFAFNQRGKAYVMGAEGPDAWDCSSLAQAAWAKAGVNLPRTAQAQRDYLATGGHGQRIPPGQEAPGDLIFWDSYLGPNEIGHVALVLDPRTTTTIEAHGHADGVGVFSYGGKVDRKSIFEIWRPA